MTKSEIQSGKVFQKNRKTKKKQKKNKNQRGKGTLYIKLSMLQENSLTNQTWDVCLLVLISSMKAGL